MLLRFGSRGATEAGTSILAREGVVVSEEVISETVGPATWRKR